MKKIVLVSDGSLYWSYVENYLGSINASVVTLPPDVSDDEITASGAGLLIIGPDHIRPMRSPLRLFKTIVISEGTRAFPEQTRASMKRVLFLQWPLSKEQFLRETATMLGISPRKSFRAAIRIFSPDMESADVGTSIDFSSSGISFASDSYYSTGHKVSISLCTPTDSGRLTLKGRVARQCTNETDGSREYGVELEPLDRKTVKALETFILS